MIGEDTSIICITTPDYINFSLVNDQLKINLNCKGVILEEEVLLNLSLVWLDEIAYIPKTNENQVQFDGSGLDDLVVEGNETSGISHTYTVKLVFAGTPDSFEWKLDNGAWSMFPFDCSTTPIHLANGIYVKFGATTGHHVDDLWVITSNVGEGIVRYAGWYLTPRWLGWQLIDATSLLNTYPVDSKMVEDFEDSTLITGMNLGDVVFGVYDPWLRGDRPYYHNVMYMTSGVRGSYCVATLANIANLKKMSFTLSYTGSNYATGAYFNVAVESIDNIVFTLDGLELDLAERLSVEIATDIFKSAGYTWIWFIGFIPEGGTGYIILDNLTLYANESLIIAKYSDGQRAKVSLSSAEGEYGLSIYSDPDRTGVEMLLPLDSIDWRVSAFELYTKNTDDLFILKGIAKVGQGEWELDGDNLKGSFALLNENEAVQTLNFNYGLGATVRVDTQHLIYSEASFNNRVYAVNGGYRILQTHIAGSGRVQPDSFPYDEDNFLGFIEEVKSSLIQSLFIINNNFLMLYMTDGFSLYQINTSPYSGKFQKELRMLASSFTGYNPKSLTRIINATSPTIGAYWVTNEGIWFHDGSLGSIPVNLITDTHKVYWESVEKDNFGFYNYQNNEYWYATKVYSEIRDGAGESREFTEFIIYEINFKTFRFVRLEKAYYELAGYSGGKALLRTNTKIGILDKTSAKSLAGLVETHWNNIETEHYNKIAQALVLELKGEYTGGTIYLKAQFDNQSLVYTFAISTDEKRIIRLFPESIRFKSVKLYVLLSNTNLAEISVSSFKLLYTEDGVGRFGEFFDHQVIIESGGYGRAYGRYYGGSNPVGAGGGFGTQYGKHYGN
jgi:hypothetical protein